MISIPLGEYEYSAFHKEPYNAFFLKPEALESPWIVKWVKDRLVLHAAEEWSIRE